MSAIAVFVRIAWVNLVAVAGVVAALFPLLARRRPVGTRAGIRDVPGRSARVIPFAERRKVQNR